MKRFSKRKALAFFMAMVTLFLSIAPCLPVIALDGENETLEEGSENKNELAANVGKQAVFDWWADFLLVDEETLMNSSADEMYDYFGNSESGYENWVLYDDIPANDLVMKIIDYHYDAENCFHWYKVDGEDLPEILKEKPWVFYSDDYGLEDGADPYLAIYGANETVRILNVNLATARSVRFILSGSVALADAKIDISDYYGEYTVSSLAYDHEITGIWSSALKVNITKANEESWSAEDGMVSIRYTAEQIATNNYIEDVCYGAAYLYLDGRVYSAAVTDKLGYDCSDVVFTNAGSSILVYEFLMPSFDWFNEYGYFAEDGVDMYDNRFGFKYRLASDMPLEVYAGYIFTDEEGQDWYWLEGDEFIGSPYFLVKADAIALGEYPEEFGDGRVSVIDSTQKAVSSITLPQYRKYELTANTSLSKYSSDVVYKWQIEYEDGKWADIRGQMSSKIKLTYGMVASLLNDDGSVNVRCKTVSGSKNAYSRPISVAVEMYDPDVELNESIYTSSGETVSITVAGNIPADATVELSETTAEGFEIQKGDSVVASLDISIKNADGTTWQPESGEVVTVALNALSLGLKDGDVFTVYHIHDGSVDVVGTYTVKNNTVIFEVDGFSQFVFALSSGEEIEIPDYSPNVGKHAVFDTLNAYYFPYCVNTPENGWEDEVPQFFAEDFSDDIKLKILDYYVLEADYVSLWYKVTVIEGSITDFNTAYFWIFQNYLGSDAYETDSLILSEVSGEEYFCKVTVDGELVSDITVDTTKAVKLSASSDLPSSAISYRWQIRTPAATDQWIGISGAYGAEFAITYGVVASMLDENGKAYIRCVAKVGSVSVNSDVITVTVVDAQTDLSMASYMTDANADDETTDEKCTITVYYMAGEGTTGLYGKLPSPLSSTYGKGTVINNVSFEIPTITGYAAYIGNDTQPSTSVVVPNGTEINSDLVYYVYYKPTQTTYTVKHYQQNALDDGYTEVTGDTKIYTGMTEEITAAVANTYEGFYNLVFVQAVIAGDGSTVIEVYYNRYYYLMKFNLDGGYGVEPIYARQGSPIAVSAPVKPGYVFSGWYLDSDQNKNIVDLPALMPSYSSGYVATWTVAQASYTIAYWIQNPNDATKYDYVYSLSNAGLSGDIVDWTVYKTIDEDKVYEATNDAGLYRYILLNEEKSAEANTDLTIAGDGSSVVNVYYDRKGYTLRFYYAMSSGNKYYVVGGSTYAFGKNATISNKGDEIKLIDHYMSSYQSQRGEVAALPTLKSGVTGYTMGTVNSTVSNTNYTYHYISFDAKYGADISELWPSDKFNSVTSIDTTTGSWNGDQAFVSAWNGEHHVKYSQDNENQTIKGKYAQLDENLLWAPSYGEPSDGVVSYLCFWENGAKVGWNIPELYRYNIYVEGYPGYTGEEKYGYAYKTYNGKKYYLIDQYNTCDDSSVSSQTQPAVMGYTAVWKDSAEISSYDTTLYAEAYDMFFYYRRGGYVMEFNNPNSEKHVSAYYQEPLSGYDYVPNTPVDANGEPLYEEGSVYFNGWYTSPECISDTKFNLLSETMPANNVILYASWIPKTYTVNIWMNSDLTERVSGTTADLKVFHGSTMNLYIPEEPENGNWNFDGWFYVDAESGVEKAFDFENSQIKQDMNIYAKWSATEAIAYKVNYVYLDGATEVELAPSTTGSELAGKTLTFFAKGGADLYPQFRGKGYFSSSPMHSITLDLEYADGVQEVTFYYVKRDSVEYVVKYYELDANGDLVVDGNGAPVALAPQKTVSSFDAVVTENAKIISGHTPDNTQKTLIIDINSDTNEIIFYYKDNPNASFYRVTHYIQSYGSNDWTVYKEDEYSSVIDANVAPPALNIDGYVLNTEISTLSGTVTKYGLELKFYYVEKSATVSYVAVGPIGVLNFGSVDVTSETVGALNGELLGSTATAFSKEFKFAGWYVDAECKYLISKDAKWTPTKASGALWADGTTYYAKFENNLTSLTIKKVTTDSEGNVTDYTATDKNQTFIFNVKGNGVDLDVTVHAGTWSVIIDGLTVGKTYTVTEKSEWSWRYSCTGWSHGTESGNGNVATITVGLNGTITFTNARGNEQWLDGDCWCNNIFKN